LLHTATSCETLDKLKATVTMMRSDAGGTKPSSQLNSRVRRVDAAWFDDWPQWRDEVFDQLVVGGVGGGVEPADQGRRSRTDSSRTVSTTTRP
jgi:hypothetical protein